MHCHISKLHYFRSYLFQLKTVANTLHINVFFFFSHRLPSNLFLQFDTDDTGSIVVYGGGALVALWLTSAVIGAIDSIPLVCIKQTSILKIFQTQTQLFHILMFLLINSFPSCWKLWGLHIQCGSLPVTCFSRYLPNFYHFG